MNLKLLILSIAAATLLIAASPMVSTSMSTDNGGAKLAIDAYSDGGGVLMINQASDTKFDNSAMNKLVFKYGDAAKSSNTTLKNQVNVLSPGATALEKAAVTTSLEIAKLVINPPVNGVTCDDGNINTTGDVWTGGTCAGTPVTMATCLAVKTAIPTIASGIYTIDPDGAGGSAPVQVYCDMVNNGGGWTLVDSFSGNNTESDLYGKGYGKTGISNISEISAAGYTYSLTDVAVVDPGIPLIAGHLSLFVSGPGTGFIDKTLPSFGSQVRAKFGNYYINATGSAVLYIGGVAVSSLGANGGSTTYIGSYAPGAHINFAETSTSVVYPSELWVK